MAQHDMIIDDAYFPAIRADISSAIQALVTNNSGATEPATPYPFMWWPDTTSGMLKMRNADNDDWVTICPLGVALSPSLAGASVLTSYQQFSHNMWLTSIEQGSSSIMVGTWDGYVLRSTNNGMTFLSSDQLGTETKVSCLAKIGFSDEVIAGTSPGGKIFRSTNDGVAWSAIGQLGSATEITALLGNSLTGLAGTDTGHIYKSSNAGASWSLIGQLGTQTKVSSLIYGTNPGVYLAGTSPGGLIYRSTDHGATWTQIVRLGTEEEISALANVFGVLLAGTKSTGQVYRSTDDGVTWSLVQRLGAETAVNCFASYGTNKWIAGTASGKIYASTDNGLTWKLSHSIGLGEVTGLHGIVSGMVLCSTGFGSTGGVSRITELFL